MAFVRNCSKINLHLEKTKIDRDPRTSSDYRKKCPFFRNPEPGPTRAHCGRHFDFEVSPSAMRVDNSICNKTSDVRFAITSTVLALFEENRKLFGSLPVPLSFTMGFCVFSRWRPRARRGINFTKCKMIRLIQRSHMPSFNANGA